METDAYAEWIVGLKNRRAAARISARIDRLRFGNFGDRKSVGKGVSELRIDTGPGYRVHYTRRANGELVILLGGGSKKSQARDIARAQALAGQME